MLKFTFRSAAIFLLSISLFSCSKVTDPNKYFNDKYAPQVQTILNKMPSEQVAEVDYINKSTFGTITHADVMSEALKSKQQYYPYFDVRKFGQNTPKRHLPNMELYDHSHLQNPSNQIPPDIFEVNYANRQYPPFKYQGARFDAIAVPTKDIYGVKTKMTHKEYLLAGNNSVQSAIDDVKNNRDSFDAENSKALIGEQKRLRYERKIAKIFGIHSKAEEVLDELEDPTKAQELSELGELEDLELLKDADNSGEDITMKEKVDDQNS